MAVVKLDEESFEALIGRPGKALVCFVADWSAECRAFAPVLEEAACLIEPRGDTVATLDVAACPDIAACLGIGTVPSLVLFEGEREVRRLSGTPGCDDLVALF